MKRTSRLLAAVAAIGLLAGQAHAAGGSFTPAGSQATAFQGFTANGSTAPGQVPVDQNLSPLLTLANPGIVSGTMKLDQTTPGTTNGVQVTNPVSAPAATAEAGSSVAGAGIAPIVNAGPSVLAASARNAYRANAQNTSGVGGYLVLVGGATVPASGATITALDWQPLPAAISGTAGNAKLDELPGVACGTGCVALMSTSLTTYTPSTMAGLMSLSAR